MQRINRYRNTNIIVVSYRVQLIRYDTIITIKIYTSLLLRDKNIIGIHFCD